MESLLFITEKGTKQLNHDIVQMEAHNVHIWSNESDHQHGTNTIDYSD